MQTLYLVMEAGGYHNLHRIMKVAGQRMVTPMVFNEADGDGDAVTLESYSVDHHGFLRVDLSKNKMVGRYFKVPRPQEPYSKGSHLLDYFEFDFASTTYLPNNL